MKRDFNPIEIEDYSFIVRSKHQDHIVSLANLLTHNLLANIKSPNDLTKKGFNIILDWAGVALTDGYLCRLEDERTKN